MRDFKGNELAIGDRVIYTHSMDGTLKEGEIVKFTAKTLTIKYGEPEAHSYTYQGKTRNWIDKKQATLTSASSRLFKLG